MQDGIPIFVNENDMLLMTTFVYIICYMGQVNFKGNEETLNILQAAINNTN